MQDLGLAAGGGFVIALAIFLVVLAILWFLLPFAVFGIKGRIDRTLEELRRQNALLARIAGTEEEEAARQRAAEGTPPVAGARPSPYRRQPPPP